MKTQAGHDPTNELFTGLVPPPPPVELKKHVLAGAHSAWRDGSEQSLWTRLWYFHGLRVVWAGAVVLLAVGHLLLPSGTSRLERVAVDTRPDVQMTEFLRPTRIAASATPNLGRFHSGDSEQTTLSMGGIS